MSFEEKVSDILAHLKRVSGSETVIGDPVTIGETTLVPITRVAFGLGIGGEGPGLSAGGIMALGGSISAVALLLFRGDKVKVYSLSGQGTTDKLTDSLTENSGRGGQL